MMSEQAQELVFEAADNTAQMFKDGGLVSGAERLRDAIKVLREGEQPVEVVEELKRPRCLVCGTLSMWSNIYCGCCNNELNNNHSTVAINRKYTTHRRLTIETVESVPVFEEIDDEQDS